MHRKPVLFGLSAAPAQRGFLLASLLPLCIASAGAMELSFMDGELAGRFDNTVSYGTAFRTQGADRNFAAETSGATDFYSELSLRNIKTQANKNDGNLNFADVGDVVSNTVKWNSTLELTYDKFGAQLSGFAFYDMALADIENTVGSDRDFFNQVDSNDIFRNGRLTPEAAEYAVQDVRLSSGYVWGDFQIGERTLNVRLGEQVLSWGEALFMQDGINQANPADLSALRLPGAEIKDALLPLPMLVLSTSLTESLSGEAFYEFGWKRSEADPVGTFYSTTDAFFGYGSQAVIVDVENSVTGIEPLAEIYNLYHRGTVPGTPMASRLSNNKVGDVKPQDDGQFGLALRYLAANLNNTEFGFYFLNYHARKPTAGAILGEAFGTVTDADTCNAAYTALAAVGETPASCAATLGYLSLPDVAPGVSDPRKSIVGGLNAVHYIDSSKYFLQYEDNLQVWGLTFSTNVGETSLSGEFAFRPDSEFLPEVGDNLIAYNALNAQLLGNGQTSSNFGSHIGAGAALSAGQTVDVTDNADMLNVSLLAIHNFGPTWIADGLTGVVEWGGAWVSGLDSGKLYAAEGALGLVPAAGLSEGTPTQYLSAFSYGYRIVVAADFNDVAAGLNLKPQLRFARDAKGNSVVGGNFVEGRMSSTLAVEAEYAGSWNFGVGTNVFWGAADRNQLKDRDNVYASVKYSF